MRRFLDRAWPAYIAALILAFVFVVFAPIWSSHMPSNDNQAGETILPGGIDVLVPDLTVARAVGTVVLLQTDGQFYRSTNAAVATYVALTSTTAALTLAAGFAGGVNANPYVFAIPGSPGAAPGDLVFITLRSDDTGATKLGAVTAAAISAADTISVTFQNAGTNGDGVLQYYVIDATL
jgi:hypothetical protein